MNQLKRACEQRPRGVLIAVALVLQIPTLLIWRPLILPDEAGFLLNAYQLGAGDPPSGLVYYPGYSLLLAPFAALTTELESMMWGVRAVNTMLAVVSVLAAHALARRLLPDAKPTTVVAIAALAQAYPAFRIFSALALSENLFIPVSLILAVLAVDLHLGDRPDRAALLIGVVGGLSFAIHARSISVSAAALVCLLSASWRLGTRLLPGLGAFAATTVAAWTFVGRTLDSRGVEIPGNDTGSSLDAILRRSTGPSVLPEWILAAAGQVFYLVIATLGLSLLVAMTMALPRWRNDAAVPSQRLIAVASVVAPMTLMSFGVSVLFMAGKGGDPAIYGRYNEAVLAPILVIGLCLATHSAATSRALWTTMVAVPLLALLLVGARPDDFYEARRQMVNITAIHPVSDTVQGIRLGVIAAVAVVVIAVVRLGVRHSAVRGSVLLAAVWLSIVAFDVRAGWRALDVLDQQDMLLEELREVEGVVGDVSCVSIDLVSIGDRWTEANYRLREEDIDFRYWLSTAGTPPPCPDFVISRRADLASSWPGTSLVAVEPGASIGLSLLPGVMQQSVLDGRPVIDEPFAPLEPTHELQLDVSGVPSGLSVGQSSDIVVRLTNRGPDALVPHLGLPGAGGINLGWEWRDPERPDDRVMEPVRIALPDIVWPGESIDVETMIRATDAPIPTGRWLLVVGAVQEGLAWLPDTSIDEIQVAEP